MDFGLNTTTQQPDGDDLGLIIGVTIGTIATITLVAIPVIILSVILTKRHKKGNRPHVGQEVNERSEEFDYVSITTTRQAHPRPPANRPTDEGYLQIIN